MAKLTDFTVKVEVATGDTPRTASPTYTDLSTYVRAAAGVSCQRGRSNEFDVQAQPGRASWEFRNTDGRFTVGNGSSPYAPVQIRRPCRVRVVYGGTTYPLWAGFIDSWGNGREETTGVARVEASDRLARAGVKMPAAILGDMLYDSPSLLFPLGEPEFSTTAGDVTGTSVPSLTVGSVGSGGSLDFGAGVAPGPDDGTVAAFTRASTTQGKRLVSPSSETITRALDGGLTGFTLEAFVRPSGTSAGVNPHAVRLWSGSESSTYLELGTTVTTGVGRFAFQDFDTAATANISGGSALSTTAFNHLAVTISAPSGGSATLRLYVNGVEIASGATATLDRIPKFTNLAIGGNSTGMWDGQIAYVATYKKALSAARIESHAAAINGWNGDLPEDRFSRLCYAAQLPWTAYTATGTGSSTLAPQPTKGQPLTSLLSQIAEAEAGVLFVGADGLLKLGVRSDRYAAPVALTLDATKPGQVREGFSLDTDDGLLVNDYTVERPQGATQRVVDDASVAAYDTQADSATLYVDTDEQARNAAEWRVFTSSEPRPRASQLEVDVVAFANSGGTVADLLGVEIGDRVQVTNLPSDIASTSTLDLFVEGIAWAFEKDTIKCRLTVSPVGAAGAVFVLNDATYGVLNSAAVLAY